jgi:DNA-binding XRE family transcriptional regulator
MLKTIEKISEKETSSTNSSKNTHQKNTYQRIILSNEKLKPCPECGAEFNIPSVRLGPAMLTLSAREYRVRCLSCWHRGATKATINGAIEAWNAREVPLHIRIRRRREALGWTGRDLANKAGVCDDTVYRMESGRVNITNKNKEKLIEALGL